MLLDYWEFWVEAQCISFVYFPQLLRNTSVKISTSLKSTLFQSLIKPHTNWSWDLIEIWLIFGSYSKLVVIVTFWLFLPVEDCGRLYDVITKYSFVPYDRNHVRETARLIQIRSNYPKPFVIFWKNSSIFNIYSLTGKVHFCEFLITSKTEFKVCVEYVWKL